MAFALAYTFHKAKQAAYERVGNGAKAEAHAKRARTYTRLSRFGALPDAACASCEKTEKNDGVTLIEVRARGPPAQYLCVSCYRMRDKKGEQWPETQKDDLKAKEPRAESDESATPIFEQAPESATLDLKLSRHRRKSLAPNETDEATKEAYSDTMARHERGLLAKQEKERRKPKVEANLAKFNALAPKAADQTLQQKLAQKPVVTSPLAPLPVNMLRGIKPKA